MAQVAIAHPGHRGGGAEASGLVDSHRQRGRYLLLASQIACLDSIATRHRTRSPFSQDPTAKKKKKKMSHNLHHQKPNKQIPFDAGKKSRGRRRNKTRTPYKATASHIYTYFNITRTRLTLQKLLSQLHRKCRIGIQTEGATVPSFFREYWIIYLITDRLYQLLKS